MRVTVDTPSGPLELEDGRLTAHAARLHTGPRPRPVRLAFAAAHVCMRAEYAAVPHRHDEPVPGAEIEPFIDWEATLAVRKRLDRHGFGVAEAMDTAQRFQVGWPVAARLIECTGALRLKHGFCAGAAADHLSGEHDEAALIEGVAWQAGFIRRHGGVPVLLPMPRLSLEGYDEEGFVRVYGAILERVEGPVLVHWLGPMFLASLEGYFPGDSFRRVMALDPAKVRGAKLSLLDGTFQSPMKIVCTRGDKATISVRAMFKS